MLSAPLIIVLTELKLFEASISESYIVAIDVLKRLPTLSTEPVILVVNILSSELMLVWHCASTLSRRLSSSLGLVSVCSYHWMNVSSVWAAPFISLGIISSELIRLS